MTYTKNGERITLTPHNVPKYKELWTEEKLKYQSLKNKSLKFDIVSFFVVLTLSVWFIASNHAKNTEIGILRVQNRELNEEIRYRTGAWESDVSNLKSELASCSAKLQNSRFSPKTKKLMSQKPEVVQEIKNTFGNQWTYATELYSRESSLDYMAVNKSSGACGLVQSLPCTKLVNQCALSDLKCQLKWGFDYITKRYGTAEKALSFHDINNWY